MWIFILAVVLVICSAQRRFVCVMMRNQIEEAILGFSIHQHNHCIELFFFKKKKEKENKAFAYTQTHTRRNILYF